MKVRELMRQNPPSITAGAQVGEVARLMAGENVRQVAVVDSDVRLVGIITAADLIAKHAQIHMPTYFSLLGYSFPLVNHRDDAEVRRALAVTAGDLQTDHVLTVGPDAEIDDAATLMFDRNVSCLPVVENDRLVGMLDEFDFVHLLVTEDAEAAAES